MGFRNAGLTGSDLGDNFCQSLGIARRDFKSYTLARHVQYRVGIKSRLTRWKERQEMSNGIQITTNELRTDVVDWWHVSTGITPRDGERNDEDAAKYIQGLVREYADEHCPIDDEFVSADHRGRRHARANLSYTNDVRDWR